MTVIQRAAVHVGPSARYPADVRGDGGSGSVGTMWSHTDELRHKQALLTDGL